MNNIHPSSEVLTQNIGKNTRIWQFCVILSNCIIGDNCNINCHVFIENKVKIGNNVTIKSGVQLWDGINIEDDVFVGPNVTFTNDLYPRSKQHPEQYIQTTLKTGASLGANCTILAGITIGKFAMVGAGSLVSKNIPDFSLWYGNPAKQKGYVTREGNILDISLRDKKGNRYKLINGEPKMVS